MSANALMVTVVGWAASTPREVVGDGVPYTSFRVATTPRYFDNRQNAWADGRTEWVTVKAFRDVAFNVAASIRKGDPVLAHGRLRTEEWVSDAGPRTSLVLEVSAVGHDLTRGCSSFGRRVHVGAAGGTAAEPVGGGNAGQQGAAADGGSPGRSPDHDLPEPSAYGEDGDPWAVGEPPMADHGTGGPPPVAGGPDGAEALDEALPVTP